MGNGIPPTPLSIDTSNVGLVNTTNVLVRFTRVSTPFIEFRILILCQQQMNSTRKLIGTQILTSSRSEANFFGGNLTFPISPTNLFSFYNCSLKISNIFANKSFSFLFYDSRYGQVTDTPTKSANTTTTPSPTPPPTLAFHISIVVAILLCISFTLIIIIVILLLLIIRFYHKRNSYSLFQTGKPQETDNKNECPSDSACE